MRRERRPGLATIDGDALLVVRRVVGREIANPRRCFLRGVDLALFDETLDPEACR
jgi:hypothetical protein